MQSNINRIKVEFKENKRLINVTEEKNINRIKVEFKVIFTSFLCFFYIILIESKWNLKYVGIDLNPNPVRY